MTRVFVALIALLAFGGISRAQPTSWELSYVAGGMDGNNNFIGGTEIRELVPWNPGSKTDAKLYAGNGYWEDVPGPEGKRNAQVLVLNSSHGFWQQDTNFSEFCPQFVPHCVLAVSQLSRLLFSKDKNGAPVSVQVLVAGTWDIRANPAEGVPVNVYAKNNTDGKWHETTLSTAASDLGAPEVRSFGAHVDTVTGQNWAFAGASPSGIFHGQLSDNRLAGQNIIHWTTGPENVEFNPSSYAGPSCTGAGRITSFAEAADASGKLKLYAAICFQIFVRVDGPQQNCNPQQVFINELCQPRWTVFWTDPTPSKSETGLRGLTSVKHQGKDALLVGEEGSHPGGNIYRIDPGTAVGVPEINEISALSNKWRMSVGFIIAPYNAPMPIWYDGTGRARRIIGLEAWIGPETSVPLPERSLSFVEDGNKYEGDGWYALRNASNSYELIHIPRVTDTPMVAVRAAASSPFPDDCNAKGQDCAIYFGGFDANHSKTVMQCFADPCTMPPLVPIPTHNTAWIVKGLSPKSPP